MTAVCQKGHALHMTSVPSEWKCDACQSHFPAHSTSHGCRTCDVDACPSCIQRRCPRGHLLILGTYGTGWACDGCGSRGAGPTCGCRTCDYDLCMNCSRIPPPGQQQQQPPAHNPHQHHYPASYQQQQTPYQVPPQAQFAYSALPPAPQPAYPPPVHAHQPPPAHAPHQHHQQPKPSRPNTPPAQPAMALRCPTNHALVLAPVPGAWVCDCCLQEKPQSEQSAGCRQCDIDVCEKCRSATNGCQGGHVLLARPMPSPWNCDRCSGHFEAKVKSHGCRTCDFDICHGCYSKSGGFVPSTFKPPQQPQQHAPAPAPHPAAPTAAAPAPPTAPAAINLKCQKSHQLVSQQYDSLWGCDSCAGRFPASAHGFGCRRCDVDICEGCAKSGGCRNGHILLTQHVPGDWNCDRCRKPHSINEQSRGCRVCDFDICQKCFRDAATVPTQPAPMPVSSPAVVAPSVAVAPTHAHAPVAAAPSVRPGGRCKAVFIGINYPGTSAELSGCINDVVTMQNLVLAHGLALDGSNSRVLVDDARKYKGTLPVTDKPTKRKILDAMRWLADGARAGDTLFLHYSGHGTQMRDQDGDEADGYDEALVPADYNHMGCIRDDDVFAIVCRDLPRGVRVTCVADCCHAGSIMDLEFEWRWRGETFIQAPPRKRRQIAGNKPSIRSRDFKIVSKKSTEADVLLFSGCKDEQTSSDVSNVSNFAHKYSGPGKAGGACTNALAEVLHGGPNGVIGFGKLLELMQKNLKRRRFEQIPQLSSSKKVDMNSPFSLFGPLQ